MSDAYAHCVTASISAYFKRPRARARNCNSDWLGLTTRHPSGERKDETTPSPAIELVACPIPLPSTRSLTDDIALMTPWLMAIAQQS